MGRTPSSEAGLHPYVPPEPAGAGCGPGGPPHFLVAAAGELAVVLGDRVLIAGGDLGRIGVADRAALVFVELAAQLQFQRVHAADELLVHLLDQSGIPGETAGIQIAHLIDQGLQLLPRLGTILHHGANLVEKVQSLVDLALGVGRVGTLLGRGAARPEMRVLPVLMLPGAMPPRFPPLF